MASGMDDPQLDTERYADDDSGVPIQYRTGPTFGERIGAKPGAMQPAPAAPVAAPAPPPIQIDASKLPPGIMPSTAKVDATVPSYGAPQAPNIQLPPAAMPPGIMRTNLTPGEVPSPAASSPSSTTLPSLMQRRSQAATPIDPKAVDPATGKPMYRMGWGQRLLGTAANALNGFARNGQPVVNVGPGATNDRFARDTGMQEKRVAGLDTDIGNQEKLAGLEQKGYEDALKQAYEGQIADARTATSQAQQDAAKARQETADAAMKRADKAPDKTASPADQRSADADKYGLKGQARLDYILTGKLPKDMMGSTRQPTDLETWMQAFRRDNKREPTADEIANRKARTRGTPQQFAQVEGKKKAAFTAARDKLKKDIDMLLPSDVEGHQQAMDRYNQAMQTSQSSYLTEIDALSGPQSSTPGQATVKAPPPNKVVPAKGAPAKANEPRVRVREKATGKTGTLPKSQVAQAIATGKYEQVQ